MRTKRIVAAAVALALGAAAGTARAGGATGTIDPTFGTGGLVRTTYGRDEAYATALAVTPDGRIVIAGSAADPLASFDDGSTDIAVARLLPDGRPDATFGAGGMLSVGTPRAAERAEAVALEPDGRIVVAGTSVHKPSNLFRRRSARGLLFRLDADGRLDPTFGTRGKVVVGRDGQVTLLWMIVTRSGRIVVSGTQQRRRKEDRWFLARYLPDGSPDPSFGRRGQTFLPAGMTAFHFTEQTDGKLVVVARGRYALARLLADGRLDETFGSGGLVRTRARLGGLGSWVTLDGRDRIVATGFSGDQGIRTQVVTARFLADGTPDRTFGRHGAVRTDPGSDEATGSVVLVAPTGRILVGGDMLSGREDNRVSVLLAYRDDGSLDPDFGDGGITRKRFGREDALFGLAFQDRSHLLACGFTWFWSSDYETEALVWRYQS